MSITKIYKADRLFTGSSWLNQYAVVEEDGFIREVVPASDLPGNVPSEHPSEHFAGCFIAPAFIDLQIYGAHKKLFAVYPETDALQKLKDYCNGGGAAYCLPTVATNDTSVFYRCIDAIRLYWSQSGEGILGLHIEGPWINPVKRGAHLEAFIHSPSLKEVEELVMYGKGVIKMITLAPEMCRKEVIECIRSHNVIVSAGHSNASYKQATDAFEGGINTATHLYNAMSPLQHREPGLVGAIFNSENVMCSVIADGHHVDYEAIRIAKKIMNDRLFAITDAVTETNEGPYQHYLAGDKYEAAGILSGSALTMIKALQNLVNHASIELSEALRMCSLYPAKVAGMENELGRIEKGHRCKLVVMSDNMELVKLIQ